jgi:DNA-3-methyladenine glycosylase
MFGPPGHAYVYFTYGMHWCFNVTTGPEGYGAGVLIRAAEPLAGIELMHKNRGLSTNDIKRLTNGPAKLAQALQINKALYGHDLFQPPLQLFEPTNRDFKVTKTTRIGISKAKDTIARYYITDNLYVSKK